MWFHACGKTLICVRFAAFVAVLRGTGAPHSAAAAAAAAAACAFCSGPRLHGAETGAAPQLILCSTAQPTLGEKTVN